MTLQIIFMRLTDIDRQIQILIRDNGTDFYLFGYDDVPLNGLWVRERRHTA